MTPSPTPESGANCATAGRNRALVRQIGQILGGLMVRGWRIALPVGLLALLVLATIFVLHRYRLSCPVGFNSDDLYGVEVCQDILGRGYEWTNWHFPYAPQLFPEQVLLLPCMMLFKDLLRVFLANSLLYHLLSVGVLTALFRQTGLGRREAFLLACAGQLFLLLSLLEPDSSWWIRFMVAPGCHTGAILAGLFLWLLVVRGLHRPMGWKGVLLFVLVGGWTVFSDRIVVGQFLGPICLTVVGLALFRVVPLRKGVETVTLGGAAYGCALGIQFLGERCNLRILTLGIIVDFSKWRESCKSLLAEIPSHVAGRSLLLGTIVALVILAPVVGLFHLYLARRQRSALLAQGDTSPVAQWHQETATAVIAVAVWFCCFCTVASCMLSGAGRVRDNQRYMLGIYFVPFLFLPFCLRFLPGRSGQLLARFAPLALVLFAAYQMGWRQDTPAFSFRELRQPYPEVCQVLDRLAREGKIHRGLATHWLARHHQYLCREPVQIKSMFGNGEPRLLVTNPNSFLAPGVHCLEVPRYDFLILNDKETCIPVSREEIGRLFGSPRETVVCGDCEIWMYDSLIAPHFSLFLRSMLAGRCRTELEMVGPTCPDRLAQPVLNFATKMSARRLELLPDGEVQVTFASPVRGRLIDVGAEFNGHYSVTFHNGEETLGTVYVPRTNYPLVSEPFGPPGIQSRLVTVPPAVRQRGWTAATIRSAGGWGHFALSHFLVYPDAERVRARQMFPGGRWRFEAELQPTWLDKDSVALDPLASEGKARFAPANYSGCTTAGPYLFLEPGRYRVEYFLKAGPTTEPWPVCTIDVASEGGKKVHAQRPVEPTEFAGQEGYQKFCLEFESDIDLGECEFRVIAYGRAALYIDRVELVCLR